MLLSHLPHEAEHHAEEQVTPNAPDIGLTHLSLLQHALVNEHQVLQLRVYAQGLLDLVELDQAVEFVHRDVHVDLLFGLDKLNDGHLGTLNLVDLLKLLGVGCKYTVDLLEQYFLIAVFLNDSDVYVRVREVHPGWEGPETLHDDSLNAILNKPLYE